VAINVSPLQGNEILHKAAVNLQVHPYHKGRVDNTAKHLLFTYIYVIYIIS
jgi:hypothetical protein